MYSSNSFLNKHLASIKKKHPLKYITTEIRIYLKQKIEIK